VKYQPTRSLGSRDLKKEMIEKWLCE